MLSEWLADPGYSLSRKQLRKRSLVEGWRKHHPRGLAAREKRVLLATFSNPLAARAMSALFRKDLFIAS